MMMLKNNATPTFAFDLSHKVLSITIVTANND